jgi:hypothetical protein
VTARVQRRVDQFDREPAFSERGADGAAISRRAVGDAAFMDQVDDQFHFVQAFGITVTVH